MKEQEIFEYLRTNMRINIAYSGNNGFTPNLDITIFLTNPETGKEEAITNDTCYLDQDTLCISRR